jgi:CheY-like chemotaxis protein/nitrogen-specific signal transduction histidine kinase/GAF domain-containing protein
MSVVLGKTKAFIVSVQAGLVFLAFVLMVGTSYFFVSRIENKNLRNRVKESISYTEANIKAVILEAETNLAGIAQTICGMILRGDSFETIQEYVLYINNYVQSNKENRFSDVIGFYGIFDVYGKIFTAGDPDCVPAEAHALHDCPWYKTAVEAKGDIGITQPFIDRELGEGSITFSRRIFDEDGRALGIVCLDIKLDRIGEMAVNTHFSEKSLGFLLNENLEIIAHPDPSILGIELRDVNIGIAASDVELRHHSYVSEFKTTNYMGVESVLFIEKLYNDWYMGVITPKVQYYQSTRTLAMILITLGAILSAMLITILLRLTAGKNEADERMRIMFDTMPLGATMQGKDLGIFDCNEAVLKLFNLPSRQKYFDSVDALSPEYQPDGKQSKMEVKKLANKAFSEGYCRFEWVHQNLNEEPIPCEVTLVRVKYNNDFVLAVYLRDLRELKLIMKKIEYREHLLNSVNAAASILLASNDEDSFDDLMTKSFGIMGQCLDVDRIHIWRNEMIDGELHFVHRYEWLSDYGRNCKPIPIGLHFPYTERPKWKKMFLRGEYISAPFSELSENDKAFLSVYEMKSIIIIPMFLEDNFWGFFSIDDCRQERTFLIDEIRILTSVGLMMSNVINRNLQNAKLREADERVRVMLDAVPMGANFWDRNNNIEPVKLIDCNMESVKLFDLSCKNEYIERFYELSPEYQPDGSFSKEKALEYVKKAFDEGYCRCEWTHQKLNGEIVPCIVTLVRVEYKGDFIVLGYTYDLRELKTTIAAKERAEQSNRFKTQFLSRMSHEVRTPINAILGITEIQLQNETLPIEFQEAVGRINNSGYLLLGIINDILDLSKIEAGKLDIAPHIYDIANLISDTVNLISIRYDSKPIEFKLIVDENIPVKLLGDELRIKQILNNLLSNAYKYTEKGEISLSVSVEFAQQEDSAFLTLVFRVTDTGQGMTTAQLDKLFDEYTRFNMETNRMVEGAGLGMSIIKNLIKLMNGDISVESSPHKGSVFTVRLPQGIAGSDALGAEEANNLMQFLHVNTHHIRKSSQIIHEYMPYGRVLVVDDMETNLYVARGLMSPYCLSFETAKSGFEAIEKIKNGSTFDIIFMDHFMPKMDGVETTRNIRELGYTNPIIALTANALSGMADMFKENGFDDFIPKPIDIRSLNSLLIKYIRDKYPPEVVKAAQKQVALLKLSSSKKEMSSSDMDLKAVFVRDAEKVLARISTIYNNEYRRKGDIKQFVIDVHAVKSALANVGEPALSAAAFELEKAGRVENMTVIKEKTPVFLETLSKLIDKFKLDEDADVESDEINNNTAFLNEKLQIIQEASENYDDLTANTALTELKQSKWRQSVKELLDSVSEYLLHSDFIEAANAVGNFLENDMS